MNHRHWRYVGLILFGIFCAFFLGRFMALRNTMNVQSFEKKLIGGGSEQERIFCHTLMKIGFNIASQQRELQIQGVGWGFDAMASELKNIHNLAVLQLFSCGISEKDARYLSSLKTLNYIEMESCSFLSLEAVRELNLPYVKTAIFRRVESTPEFASVIQSMKNVEELHLRHISSIEPLMAALAELPKLETLYLYENPLTPQEVKKLSQLRKLLNIEIDEKSITPDDIEAYSRCGVQLHPFKKEE